MLSFILVDAAGAEVRAVDSHSHADLGGAPGGMQWIEVPYPAREWTVALSGGQLVPVPRVRTAARSLEVARAEKAAAILKARREFEERPLVVDGVAYLGDEASRTMLANTMVLAREFEEATGQAFATVWKRAGSGVVTLSRVQLRALALALGARVQSAFVREAQLLGSVAAASTVAAVNAVQWTDPT